MGTNPQPSTNIKPTTADPGSQAGTDQIGILVELRVISFLLSEGLNLNVDLDALRQQVLPYTS